MRPDQIVSICLVNVVQAVLLISAATSRPLPKTILAILAFLVPIPLYVWALRGTFLAPKASHRVVRLLLLGIVAVAISAAGFILGLGFMATVPSD
jgi:hypothetical protein